MKDLIPGLFSFDGRMGRAEFWLLLIALSFASGGILLIATMIVLSMVDATTAEALRPVHAGAQLLMQLITLWPTLAILTKRGHDRNYPAAMSIGLWAAATALVVAGAFVPFITAIAWLIWIYVIVDYGFFPGTPGRNRYDGQAKSRSPAHDVLRAAETFD